MGVNLPNSAVTPHKAIWVVMPLNPQCEDMNTTDTPPVGFCKKCGHFDPDYETHSACPDCGMAWEVIPLFNAGLRLFDMMQRWRDCAGELASVIQANIATYSGCSSLDEEEALERYEQLKEQQGWTRTNTNVVVGMNV